MRDKVITAAVSAGRSPDEVTCALNVEVALSEGTGPDVIAGPPLRVAKRTREFVAMGFYGVQFHARGASS
jgi:hypothetical protein